MNHCSVSTFNLLLLLLLLLLLRASDAFYRSTTTAARNTIITTPLGSRKDDIDLLREATFNRNIAADLVMRTVESLKGDKKLSKDLLRGKWELVFSSLIKGGYFPITEVADFYGFSLGVYYTHSISERMYV